ncbi:MAG TPA: hypothetical protein VG965_01400 [Patescibacteria group bacterium]|nr:hypothetical protein [Patescibacteria group bacterium]
MKKLKRIKVNKYVPKPTEETETKEIIITDSDKILYIFKRDKAGKYTEVVNVSFIARINEEWIPVVRYDSTHGYLHRHKRILIKNELETTDTNGVKKKGGHHTWLTWALNDLRKNFGEYRRLIFKRSKMIDNYY